MKWKIAIPILIVIVSVGAFVYLKGGSTQSADIAPAASEGEELVVSPQEARDTVTIKSAALKQPGYVVIRNSDGKRLGQIVEISKYLETGEHKDIKIVLGDFYTYKPEDQLIATIYDDNDGDQSFSGPDQPVADSTGAMLAWFVETGERVPASVTSEVAAPSGGMGMETVQYTNNGFQPKKLTVPVGTMVEFVNQSDAKMWVASNVHPGHELLPTFDQFKAVEKGQTYMYTFNKKGAWPYHDHENPALEGIITVE